MYKTNAKNKTKRLGGQLLLSKSWKSDNHMEINREKSNIAITIL